MTLVIMLPSLPSTFPYTFGSNRDKKVQVFYINFFHPG